jgi:hypothetical protein
MSTKSWALVAAACLCLVSTPSLAGGCAGYSFEGQNGIVLHNTCNRKISVTLYDDGTWGDTGGTWFLNPGAEQRTTYTGRIKVEWKYWD